MCNVWKIKIQQGYFYFGLLWTWLDGWMKTGKPFWSSVEMILPKSLVDLLPSINPDSKNSDTF
jgi:hypothetical protein